MKKIFGLLFFTVIFAAGVWADNSYRSLSAYKTYAQKVFGQKLNFVIKQRKEFEVIFVIKQNGSLENVRMLKSAGKELDAKIEETIRNIKLDPIPPEFNKKEIYYKFGLSPNAKNEEILKYERVAWNTIMQNIPVASSRKAHEIWFNVTIDCDGLVQNVEILQSSGREKYDAEVVRAMNSLHFPAFSDTLKLDTVEIPIRANKHR